MLNKLSGKLSNNLLKWLRPKKFIEAVHNSCLILADAFRGSLGILNSSYDRQAIRSAGTCVAVPMGNITTANVVAGLQDVTTDTIAGSSVGIYKFFIVGLPVGLVAVGKSPDSALGVLYRDFIPHGNGYLFKESPDKFGTPSKKDGRVVVHFYCVGCHKKVAKQPQFRHLYNNTQRPEVVSAVYSNCSRALALSGVNGEAIHAAAGVEVLHSTPSTVISWEEGNKKYIVTDTEICRCPSELDISDNMLSAHAGHPITSKHLNSTIVFPVGGHWYWLDDHRVKQDAIPNAVYDEYKELVKESPLLPQLRAILRSRGITTVDTTYAGLCGDDVTVISKCIPTPNTLHVVKHIDIDIRENSVAGLDKNAVDTLYILYGGGSEHRVTPGASAVELLRNTTDDRGVLRITSCIRSDSTIYAISSNSMTYGSRINTESKIYGIVAVISGNTPEEDVVYSYKNISNTSFGAGLEVIVTAVI